MYSAMIDNLINFLRATFRFCASVKLAMLLMAVIILASIFGTIVESGFNAAVAQAYVYDAPWFYFWMALLCTNLIAAVISKYPWKAHQYGFVITHAAIVIMLVGAVVGRIWGIEGNITISDTGGPQNFLVVNETLLQIRQPNHPVKTFPLRLNLRNPSSERPFEYEAGSIKVSVLDVANELGIRQVVEPAASNGTPALRLIMAGEAAPHPIDRWLVMDHARRGTLSLGRNHVRFVGASSGTPAESASRQSQQGDSEPMECCPTDTPAEPVTVVAADDCCDENHPPATGHGTLHSTHASHGSGNRHLDFRFEDGVLIYESTTAEGTQSGTITVGEEFSAGWAGWKFKVEEFIEQATLRDEIGPMTAGGMQTTGASGIYVRLDDGTHNVEEWLKMGTMSGLRLGHRFIHASFGFRLHPLDFTVDLERFEVEFNPGTQTPASFKSHVVFTAESGEQTRRSVWMNNPTNFPDFAGVGLLGTSYKFSQSSWNPGDLSQTTLQVIRDPGWSLKWIGSLLFCLGLLMIFYLKPYPRFARKQAQAVAIDGPQLIHRAAAAPVRGTLQKRREEMVLK